MELLRKREENADQANAKAFKDLIRGYVVGVTPEEKAKAEQDFAKSQAKNLEAQGKLNKARRLVQNSGKKKVNEALDLLKEILVESNPEAIQKVANKRAYDAGYHSQKQFNDGEVTPEGKRAQKKFAKIKELIRKREDRTGDWAVKHSELADNCNKGWEDSKK